MSLALRILKVLGDYLYGFLYGCFVDLRRIQWEKVLGSVAGYCPCSICTYTCEDKRFYFLLQEILHQRFMAIFELWLAERQTDSDFTSRTFNL